MSESSITVQEAGEVFANAFGAYEAAALRALETGTEPDFSAMQSDFTDDLELVVAGDHGLSGEFQGFNAFADWLVKSGSAPGFEVAEVEPQGLDGEGRLVVIMHIVMDGGPSRDTLKLSFRDGQIARVEHTIGNEELARKVYGPKA